MIARCRPCAVCRAPIVHRCYVTRDDAELCSVACLHAHLEALEDAERRERELDRERLTGEASKQ